MDTVRVFSADMVQVRNLEDKGIVSGIISGIVSPPVSDPLNNFSRPPIPATLAHRWAARPSPTFSSPPQ